MTTIARILPVGLLAALLVAGCGGGDDAGQAGPGPAAASVDPEELVQTEVVLAPRASEAEVPPWTPVIEAIPANGLRKALSRAGALEKEGRWLAAPAEAIGEVESSEPAPPEPGALEIYLGVLATDATQADALEGVARVLAALEAQGRAALAEGRFADAEQVERVIVRAQPANEALAAYREALRAARRAQEKVRLAEAREAANRIFRPEGQGAVAAYREALSEFAGYLPAQDGLARLQARHLDRALAAAQEGRYPDSERLQAEAGRILPGSAALQDMLARIVELRQARTETLLAQGHAAVDALDLELAGRRLAEAEQVSLQAQGLDALRERIELARHYGHFRPGQVFREPLAGGGEGPEMVVLPHGSFLMGSPEDERGRAENEGPRHEVAFGRGFAMARNEATVADFRAFVEATGHRSLATRRGRSTVYDERGGVMGEHSRVDWRRDYAGSPAAPNLPVVHVAFEDAQAYAAWLSAQTGQRYRLPSEAEFEYAMRAGRQEAWPWGDGLPTRVVGNLTGDGDQSRIKRRWSNAIPGYSDGHWGPAPVRSFPAEGFGTFDLVGNVSEWVLDCWHDSYRRAPRDGSAWVNPGCTERVVRGASWASSIDRARSAYRQSTPADTTNARLGFRVVREL
ncbi:formylglycine-generating enzyme family protein [Arenimonas sp.]|uniref:formylglycine-generating enzyme family protein n=1 Tax=Arenimonas sp. TaxID=1872635 RepID=UPI0025D198BD|nr:formylglycine-generating enzyme family protein [Arenimonas sp.]